MSKPTVVPPPVKEMDLKKTFFKNLIMGGAAGITGSLCTYPLDLVKTTMQMQTKGVSEAVYKNSWECFTGILKKNGPRGLYRGLGAQLVGIAPEKALKLTINDTLRSIFTDKKTGEIKIWQEAVSGAAAGFTQVIVTNPYELVKVRLQTQKVAEGHQRKSAMMIINELGPRGLFTGAGACLLRDVPFSIVYFTLYGNLKRIPQKDENGRLSAPQLFLCGVSAGAVSAATVTPCDVVKTRLQAQTATPVKQYTGIVNCFSTIVQKEGMPALFKGTVPRVMIIAPLFGITLMTYEVLQGFFA